jgi:hypothetical protein
MLFTQALLMSKAISVELMLLLVAAAVQRCFEGCSI